MNELYSNYLKSSTNWKIGIYCRLSREDEKEDLKKSSESIENQLNFLNGYVSARGWKTKREYKDDGFSGTNFERPGFKRMILDIENNEINMVITKDLSRLGRDYIDTGYYIEKYFPSKNIRYIAITDNVDTFEYNNTNNDMTPIKTVFNDMYAKDTSKKVRAILMGKAKNGESIKAFQPYGYKKDPKNKNKILVDKNVSSVVTKIFQMYKLGKTKKQICDYLNKNNIMTPLKYKEQTTNYKNPNKKCYAWSSSMITKILRDEIYIGNLIQHKYMKVNYKVKTIIKVNPSQQIVIKNNHEPIIDAITFNTVQKMLDKQFNEWSYNKFKYFHLLKGLVYCSCGSKISYNKNHGKYFRCICNKYKRVGSKFCNNIQYLKEDELIYLVIKNLKENIKKYLDIENLQYKIKIPEVQENEKEIKNQIELLKQKRKNIYEDKLNSIIDTELFIQMSNEIEEKKKHLDFVLEDIKQKNEIKKIKINDDKVKQYVKNILEFNERDEITRSLLLKLIDKIVIENKKIRSISYNFTANKVVK